MNKARLENWKLVAAPWTDAYTPPECIYQVLIGEIYDDSRTTESGEKRFVEGKEIRTGTVRSLNIKNRTATTNRTVYTLGTPDPDFLEWLRDNNYPSYGELTR